MENTAGAAPTDHSLSRWLYRLLALPRQPEYPRWTVAIFAMDVARRLNIPLLIEPVEPPLLVDILRMDLAGGGHRTEKLNVDRVQFAFH